jgi:hypothetical protein
MRIAGLSKYRRRPSVNDLPASLRSDAWEWYRRFMHRRKALGKPTPPWTRAILMGQAKRLALNPPTSAWGRSMLAKRGGLAVQRQYRLDQRTGDRHPAHRAAAVSASRRNWTKQQQDAVRREQSGMPPKPRWKRLPLG